MNKMLEVLNLADEANKIVRSHAQEFPDRYSAVVLLGPAPSSATSAQELVEAATQAEIEPVVPTSFRRNLFTDTELIDKTNGVTLHTLYPEFKTRVLSAARFLWLLHNPDSVDDLGQSYNEVALRILCLEVSSVWEELLGLRAPIERRYRNPSRAVAAWLYLNDIGLPSMAAGLQDPKSFISKNNFLEQYLSATLKPAYLEKINYTSDAGVPEAGMAPKDEVRMVHRLFQV